MRLKKSLIYPFVCMFLAGCYYWPCVWSDSPQTFTFTLDKYEVKEGDKITVDTGDVRVFDEGFKLCSEVYYKNVENSDDDPLIHELYEFTMIEKISSTRAVFEVPENIIGGILTIWTNFTQKEECSCDSGTWYSGGNSDKKLVIVK